MTNQYTAFRYERFPMSNSLASMIISKDSKVEPEENIIQQIKWRSPISEEEMIEEIYVYVDIFGRVNAVEGESFFLAVTET